MGFKDLAKKAAVETPSKKSNNMPELAKQELKAAVFKYFQGSEMVDAGTALVAQAQAEITPEAENFRLEMSQKGGECLSSVKVLGDNGQAVMATTKCAYSKIDSKHEETLKTIAGEKFNEFFKTQMAISLTPSFMEDEKAQEAVLKAIGEENFSKFFKVETSIVPTKAFHEQRSTNKEIGNLFQKLNSEGIVKPYATALRKS